MSAEDHEQRDYSSSPSSQRSESNFSGDGGNAEEVLGEEEGEELIETEDYDEEESEEEDIDEESLMDYYDQVDYGNTSNLDNGDDGGSDFYYDAFDEDDYFSNGDPENESDSDGSNFIGNDATVNNGEENDMNSGSDHPSEAEIAPAREHSYLPGTTNPLYPEQWLLQPHHQLRHQIQPHHQPLTTTSPNENSKVAPTTTTVTACNGMVEIPILQLEGVVLFPNSTVPLRLTDMCWVRYLSRQIAIARDGCGYNGFGDVNGGDHGNGDARVRIGIVTKLNSSRRPRRRIYDISREDQLQHQHHSRNDNSSDNQNSTNNNNANNVNNDNRGGSARMGRWNLEMIRRGILVRRQNSSSHNDSDNSDNDNESSNERIMQRHERYLQHPIHHFSSTSSSQGEPRFDPLWGRIGTFATITYTHEDPLQSPQRIIVTALTT